MTGSTNGLPPLRGPADDLVQQGWVALRDQQPLAARAFWQRALAVSPEHEAAREALERLNQARDLPEAARQRWLYRLPEAETLGSDPNWNTLTNLEGTLDPHRALELFDALLQAQPDDPIALYDRGITHAGLGRSSEAIDDLQRAISAWSRQPTEADHQAGVEAALLAEVLRSARGAERHASDLSYRILIDLDLDQGAPPPDAILGLLGPENCFRRLPTPSGLPEPDSASRPSNPDDLVVLDWLDRPPISHWPDPTQSPTPHDLRHVLGSVIVTPTQVRISSPTPAIERASEWLALLGLDGGHPGVRIHRQITPLTMLLLDASVLTFRVPPNLDEEVEARTIRQAIASEYENHWIHLNRQGLGCSPIQAVLSEAGPNPEQRIYLEAILRYREQLGARPGTASLYQGYPFERLWRRLGLVLPPDSDLEDLECWSLSELKKLQPDDLSESQRIRALRSILGLRHDPLSATWARWALDQEEGTLLDQPESPDLIAALIRGVMSQSATTSEPIDEVWTLIDQAEQLSPTHRDKYQLWRAELLARTDRSDASAEIYRRLAESSPEPDRLALLTDGVETLLDNDHRDQAQRLIERIRQQHTDRPVDQLRLAVLERAASS